MKTLFEGFGVTAKLDNDNDCIWFDCDHDTVHIDSVDVLFWRGGYGLSLKEGYRIIGQLITAKNSGERAIINVY